MKMSVQLVVILRSKLVAIDGILPVLMELKSRYRVGGILLCFHDHEHLEGVRKNYILWKAIESIHAKTLCLHDPNKGRVLWNMMNFLVRTLFRRNILFKSGDTMPRHRLVESLMRVLSRTTVVKYHFAFKTPELAKNCRIERSVVRRRNGMSLEQSTSVEWQYDYFMSELAHEDLQENFGSFVSSDKHIAVGYTRGMTLWREFIRSQKMESRIEGAYCLYVLSFTGAMPRMRGLCEPPIDELIVETLQVLKKHCGSLCIVFKPHIYTDMEEMKKIIERVGYTNYVIDYGHPMLLASGAKFVIGNGFSTTMADCFFIGIPVVEYSYLDRELFEKYGRKSCGGQLVDFFSDRDPKKLDDVVCGILKGALHCRRDRDFIEKNFPQPSEKFFGIFDELIK